MTAASPASRRSSPYHPATGHTLVVLSNYHDSALPLMEEFPRQFEQALPEQKAQCPDLS